MNYNEMLDEIKRRGWDREVGYKHSVRTYYVYDDGGKHLRGPLGTVRASNEVSAIHAATKKWPKSQDFFVIRLEDPTGVPSEHIRPGYAGHRSQRGE